MPHFSAQCVKGVQVIRYACAFLLSLVICVPMSMHQDQFKGRCLLFSTGEWQEVDGQFKVNWASQAYCNFTIFVAVIMFVISLVQMMRYLKLFFRGRDSTFFGAFVDVIVCGFMCLMTLTAALFVSLGFKVWCEEMTKRFEFCQDAVGNDIDKADGIDSSGFFNQMFTSQFGIWFSVTVWCTLSVFSVVKLCRYHHEENLRVSMAKERKRLINEDAVSEVPVQAEQDVYVAVRRGPVGGGRLSNVWCDGDNRAVTDTATHSEHEVVAPVDLDHEGPLEEVDGSSMDGSTGVSTKRKEVSMSGSVIGSSGGDGNSSGQPSNFNCNPSLSSKSKLSHSSTSEHPGHKKNPSASSSSCYDSMTSSNHSPQASPPSNLPTGNQIKINHLEGQDLFN